MPPMNIKARIYIAAVGLSGMALAVNVLAQLHVASNVVPIVLLTIASFLTQIYELEIIPGGWHLSTNAAIATAAVFIGGEPLAVFVIVLSTVPAELLLRWDRIGEGWERFFAPVLFNTSQLVLSVVVASAAFRVLADLLPGTGLGYLVSLATFTVYFVVNMLLVTGIVALTTSGRIWIHMRAFWRTFALQVLVTGVLAILIATLYAVSPINLVLLMIPLALVHFSTHNYLRLRRESHHAFKKITDLLDQRDPYTGAHSDDVEYLAMKLARRLKLSDDQIEAVQRGAAIHDIGKIAIPDAILHKPGRLDHDEFETMKQHTVIGAEIIGELSIYRNVVPIVRHEHEHWDGSGYPDGLAGDAIPIEARIVAVADVYSALTTERGYRTAQGQPLKYTHDLAHRIMMEMAGNTLDPDLVRTFLDMMAPKDTDGAAEQEQ